VQSCRLHSDVGEMALVDYGSDSDSEQAAAQAPPRSLAAPADPTHANRGDNDDDDDEDDEYNPQDAFGLARIAEEERKAAVTTGGGGASLAPSGSSAPQVIAAVSRSLAQFMGDS
jgi:hypothetical protein